MVPQGRATQQSRLIRQVDSLSIAPAQTMHKPTVYSSGKRKALEVTTTNWCRLNSALELA